MSTPTPEQHATILSEIGNYVNAAGGVGGITQKFNEVGLNGLISSWIGSGPNSAISGEQVVSVLGHDRVSAIAAKVGLSEEVVASSISVVMPKLIDALTPSGQVAGHTPTLYESAFNFVKADLFKA